MKKQTAKRSAKKAVGLVRFAPQIILIAVILGAVIFVISTLAISSDREVPLVGGFLSETDTTQNTLVKNLSFNGIALINYGKEDSSYYRTSTIELYKDANFGDYVACNSDVFSTGIQTVVGTTQGFNLRQCTYEPTAQYFCSADKAGTTSKPCAYDQQGITRQVYFSLEKPAAGTYQVLLQVDDIIPDKRDKKRTQHWVISKVLKNSSFDNTIATRRISNTDFYEFNCTDKSVYSATATSCDGLYPTYYFKPSWSDRFFMVELHDTSMRPGG